MREVQFSTEPAVCVMVWGEEDEELEEPSEGSLRDGGLVERLEQFLSQKGIKSIVPFLGVKGGGRFINFFSPKDAAKIEAWLRKQKVQKIPHL